MFGFGKNKGSTPIQNTQGDQIQFDPSQVNYDPNSQGSDQAAIPNLGMAPQFSPSGQTQNQNFTALSQNTASQSQADQFNPADQSQVFLENQNTNNFNPQVGAQVQPAYQQGQPSISNQSNPNPVINPNPEMQEGRDENIVNTGNFSQYNSNLNLEPTTTVTNLQPSQGLPQFDENNFNQELQGNLNGNLQTSTPLTDQNLDTQTLNTSFENSNFPLEQQFPSNNPQDFGSQPEFNIDQQTNSQTLPESNLQLQRDSQQTSQDQGQPQPLDPQNDFQPQQNLDIEASQDLQNPGFQNENYNQNFTDFNQTGQNLASQNFQTEMQSNQSQIDSSQFGGNSQDFQNFQLSPTAIDPEAIKKVNEILDLLTEGISEDQKEKEKAKKATQIAQGLGIFSTENFGSEDKSLEFFIQEISQIYQVGLETKTYVFNNFYLQNSSQLGIDINTNALEQSPKDQEIIDFLRILAKGKFVEVYKEIRSKSKLTANTDTGEEVNYLRVLEELERQNPNDTMIESIINKVKNIQEFKDLFSGCENYLKSHNFELNKNESQLKLILTTSDIIALDGNNKAAFIEQLNQVNQKIAQILD